MRFELTTPTLARLCSTPELRPLSISSILLYYVSLIKSTILPITLPMTLPLPPPPVTSDSLLSYLDALGFSTHTTTHPPLFTVADSKRIEKDLPGAHTKNLFLKDKSSNYFLLTAEQDSIIDLKGLHRLIGAKGRVSFAKPEMLLELLGVLPGSVTAFGLINDRQNAVKFVLDVRLTFHETINCHPLTNEATTNIKYKDLIAFIETLGHDVQIVDLQQGVESL